MGELMNRKPPFSCFVRVQKMRHPRRESYSLFVRLVIWVVIGLLMYCEAHCGGVRLSPFFGIQRRIVLAMSELMVKPRIGQAVYLAPTAYVGGDVTLGDRCTVMHHVTIRGDIARITIGDRVNVQDGTVIHTKFGVPLDIASDVGIGHRAVVHCRRVGSRTLIGIGAIVLDDCEIGSRCLIAAGTVLPPGTIVPDGSVVMGVPGKVVRATSESDLAIIDHVIRSYLDIGRRHGAGEFPNIASPGPNPA
jgi:gamma-carbonic anhydrase